MGLAISLVLHYILFLIANYLFPDYGMWIFGTGYIWFPINKIIQNKVTEIFLKQRSKDARSRQKNIE